MDAPSTTNVNEDRFIPKISAIGAPHLLFLLQIVVLWPVWLQMAARFSTSSEVLVELLPLVAVAFFSWSTRPELPVSLSSSTLYSSAFLLFVYVISIPFVPFTFRALIAFASITVLISSWRFGVSFHLGVFALFCLSLPLTDSLNFFLGFPMRAFVGDAVVFLVRLQGIELFRDGVSLHFGDKLIWIDAPCSGIKMLWFGSFLATVLSLIFRLSSIKLLAALLLSFIGVLLGNVLRASALFYVEGGLIEAPEWMHSAIGVVAFAITSIFIVLVVKLLSGVKWRK